MNYCPKRKTQGGNESMLTNTEVKELGHFMNGEIVAGTSGHFSDVFNPSSGAVIARVPIATKEEVQGAIAAAKAAFPAWRALSIGKRVEIVMKFRQLMTARMD